MKSHGRMTVTSQRENGTSQGFQNLILDPSYNKVFWANPWHGRSYKQKHSVATVDPAMRKHLCVPSIPRPALIRSLDGHLNFGHKFGGRKDWTHSPVRGSAGSCFLWTLPDWFERHQTWNGFNGNQGHKMDLTTSNKGSLTFYSVTAVHLTTQERP